MHGAKYERGGDLIRAECWYRIAAREGSIQGHDSLKRVQNQRIPNSITAKDTREYQRNLDKANEVIEKDKIAPSLTIPKEEERVLVEVLTPRKAAATKQFQKPKQATAKAGKQVSEPPAKTRKIKALETRAENGDKDAQFELGQHYEKKGSKKQANQWYQRAAELGHMDAKFRLGVLYLQKAIKLFQDAAEQNHVQAVEELDRLTKPGATPLPDSVLQHIWMHDTEEDEQFSISSLNRQTHKTGVGYPAGTSYQAQDFSAYEVVAEKATHEEDKEEDADLLRVWMERHSSVEGGEAISIADGATGNHGNDDDTNIWPEEEEEECAETEASGHVEVDSEQRNIELSDTPLPLCPVASAAD